MKKNDGILIAVILCIAGLGLLVYTGHGRHNADYVIVTVDGVVRGTYSLSEDREVRVNGTNVFAIKNGEVSMVEADCPDQICVNHKKISKNKESIICLPNKVVLEISNHVNAEFDAVVH